jgi:hypothetical protein
MQFCVTRVILRDLAALVPQIFHSLHKITHFLTGYIISYFIPKFNFLLRTTPFWKFSNYVNSIDSSLKSSLARILNLRLTDLQPGVSPLYRLDLAGWEFVPFPIFVSLLSYLQFNSIIKFKG